MERTITYKITDSGQNIRIDSFLRKHGYSMQNLTLLKKMPESILKNGEWSYMQTTLQAGDILTVRIQEETSSPNIPAVNLPIDIVYEDEDIIVINKAAGMPIHPSLNNYGSPLRGPLRSHGSPASFRHLMLQKQSYVPCSSHFPMILL